VRPRDPGGLTAQDVGRVDLGRMRPYAAVAWPPRVLCAPGQRVAHPTVTAAICLVYSCAATVPIT